MTAVARSWVGRVPAHRSDEYLAYLRRTGLRDLRATSGNRSVQIMRRTTRDITAFRVVSTWDSEEAIRAFAGDEADTARYYPEDAGFLLEMSEKAPPSPRWEVRVWAGRSCSW